MRADNCSVNDTSAPAAAAGVAAVAVELVLLVAPLLVLENDRRRRCRCRESDKGGEILGGGGDRALILKVFVAMEILLRADDNNIIW